MGRGKPGHQTGGRGYKSRKAQGRPERPVTQKGHCRSWARQSSSKPAALSWGPDHNPTAHFIDEKTEAPEEVAKPNLGPRVLSRQTTLHTGSLKCTFIHVKKKKNPKEQRKNVTQTSQRSKSPPSAPWEIRKTTPIWGVGVMEGRSWPRPFPRTEVRKEVRKPQEDKGS